MTKRKSNAHEVLKKQKGRAASDWRFGEIDRIAQQQAKKQKYSKGRNKRFDLIVKLKIKAEKEFILPTGEFITPKSINVNGIIDTWSRGKFDLLDYDWD